MMRDILAADIGGTNSRFGHFQSGPDGALVLLEKRWLPTAEAASFAELLDQLARSGFSLPAQQADSAVIAIAGPVEQGVRAVPPNIAWTIDLEAVEVSGSFSRACLINDFAAQAYACVSPMGRSARVILPGEPVRDAMIGVLGAGTGLGKAMLVPVSGSPMLAMPSEGGHALFPFSTEKEWAFQAFCRKKSGQDHITGDLVVSGSGLRFVHWFLTGEDLEPSAVAARFAEAPETLAWFARFFGRACRNFALEVLARGGLFIAGGVAGKNPKILLHEQFHTEFLDSPTMGHVLKRIPVHLLDDQDSGLWGAAFHGRQLLHKKGNPSSKHQGAYGA
jgi:glucokinase